MPVGRFVLRMATRKGQRRGKRAAGGGSLPLVEEIERSVESAARKLIKSGNLSVSDLVKLRDIVREILAERPHEVVVRWVDPWEMNRGETKGGEADKEAKAEEETEES